MKTIRSNLKAISFFVIALILLQSCTVYKSAGVTIEEASKTQNKVKVYTTDNETLKFKRISFKDGKYYGVKSNYPERDSSLEDIPLDKKNIKSIKVKNKTTSTVLTVAIPVVVVGGLVYGGSTMSIGIGSAMRTADWDY